MEPPPGPCSSPPGPRPVPPPRRPSMERRSPAGTPERGAVTQRVFIVLEGRAGGRGAPATTRAPEHGAPQPNAKGPAQHGPPQTAIEEPAHPGAPQLVQPGPLQTQTKDPAPQTPTKQPVQTGAPQPNTEEPVRYGAPPTPSAHHGAPQTPTKQPVQTGAPQPNTEEPVRYGAPSAHHGAPQTPTKQPVQTGAPQPNTEELVRYGAPPTPSAHHGAPQTPTKQPVQTGAPQPNTEEPVRYGAPPAPSAHQTPTKQPVQTGAPQPNTEEPVRYGAPPALSAHHGAPQTPTKQPVQTGAPQPNTEEPVRYGAPPAPSAHHGAPQTPTKQPVQTGAPPNLSADPGAHQPHRKELAPLTQHGAPQPNTEGPAQYGVDPGVPQSHRKEPALHVAPQPQMMAPAQPGALQPTIKELVQPGGPQPTTKELVQPGGPQPTTKELVQPGGPQPTTKELVQPGGPQPTTKELVQPGGPQPTTKELVQPGGPQPTTKELVQPGGPQPTTKELVQPGMERPAQPWPVTKEPVQHGAPQPVVEDLAPVQPPLVSLLVNGGPRAGVPVPLEAVPNLRPDPTPQHGCNMLPPENKEAAFPLESLHGRSLPQGEGPVGRTMATPEHQAPTPLERTGKTLPDGALQSTQAPPTQHGSAPQDSREQRGPLEGRLENPVAIAQESGGRSLEGQNSVGGRGTPKEEGPMPAIGGQNSLPTNPGLPSPARVVDPSSPQRNMSTKPPLPLPPRSALYPGHAPSVREPDPSFSHDSASLSSFRSKAPDTLSYLDSVSLMSGTMESLSHLDDASSLGSDSEINGAPYKRTDKYGFLGGNQYSSNGESCVPVEVARQRELKWLDMFGHWDKWVLRRFQKVKLRCRKGIPSSLRARAWQYLCNGHELLNNNPGKFEEMERQAGDPKWLDVIEKDLHRQFPFHEMFAARGGHGQQDLYRILKAYTVYRPEEGYCQAQAPVAAVLLMHMPAEQAFWCLVQICDKYLPGYYSAGLEAIQLDGEIFFALLRRICPMAYRHLKKFKIDPILYMTEWFMCVFSRTLPWASVLRVWDMFFCEGVKVIFRVGLVLLRHTLGSVDKLRGCQGMYETMEKLRALPPHCLQEEVLLPEVSALPVTDALIERESNAQLRKWRENRGELQYRPSRRMHGSRQIYEEKLRLNPALSGSRLSLSSLRPPSPAPATKPESLVVSEGLRAALPSPTANKAPLAPPPKPDKKREKEERERERKREKEEREERRREREREKQREKEEKRAAAAKEKPKKERKFSFRRKEPPSPAPDTPHKGGSAHTDTAPAPRNTFF